MNYIDVDAALARTRGNKVLYCRLLGMFLGSKEFDSFEAAISTGDYEQAGQVAHGIKGMTGNLALMPLSKVSETLMHQLRQGIFDEKLYAEYKEVLAGTISEVQAYMNS